MSQPTPNRSPGPSEAIELRETEAGGPAADVARCLDTMLLKNGKKNLDFEVRVADGEEWVGAAGVRIHEKYT